MGFRKEMREGMKELFRKMDELTKLYGTMEGLKEQNEQLFDKLIAKDWGEYSSSPSVVNREEELLPTEKPLLPSQDEAMIGEILSDEEITGE